MKEIIRSKNNFCTGCNRCVRECPMEAANITYQDEDGNIKVRIDHEKCIVCGRCISACKHNARYFADDTQRFIDDLAKGIPISVIAAPSIKTNIPEYKRLFTWLKKLGVNKIYDVSFGADICVWAHVRNIKENGPSPVISQPCPVIVSYCELYRHDLLPRLSPVHSPMACISIYMKEYQGVNDRIAALTPCIAKTNEIEATKLADYNITFLSLRKYLAENIIDLPGEETQFDHDDSGLGSLFPMPGGFKENVEYFTGKDLHIAKAEGFTVYGKLDEYAKTSLEFLPDIFDVLNCTEGCNLGSAYSHDRSIFEIDKKMNDNIKKSTEAHKREHYQAAYKLYDDTLDISRFLRKYQPVIISSENITDEDINRAFELLGKTSYEKQNIDCGACGSETCRRMARKIALCVNIPGNCIVKSSEDAKKEHKEKLLAHGQILEMEKSREADGRMRIMLNANPYINILFDSCFKLVDCNTAAFNFMGFKTKEEMLAGFTEKIKKSIAESRAEGRKTERLFEKLIVAAKKGFVRFETGINLDSGYRSLDVEFRRIPYGKEYAIVGYVYDLTSIRDREIELTRTQEKNELQLTILNAVVNATKIGLWEVEVVDNDPNYPGNVFRWSDEFRYMLGYSSVIDFPNTFASWNNLLHPDDKEEALKAINEHLVDKTGKTPYDVEYRLLRKNGEYAYIHACGESIRDKNGNVIRIAGAVMDITESKKVLLKKEKERMEAEEANKAKSIFLSNMSHEIRTPLNAIIGMTTIGKVAADIGKKDDAFNKIEGASKHLLGVINDILDMSKIEANKLELSPVSFEFKKMLQKIVDIMSIRINARRQKFQMSTDKNIPDILIGDDQRLTQVITNLLSNAVKFTSDEGSIHLDCRLASEKDGMCRLEISVSDTGIGISEEQKVRLFDSFEQAEAGTSRNFGGTGLGLSISKRIVELMDGDIDLESELGKGSKFTISVLLKRDDSTESEINDKDFNIKSDYTDVFRGKTILLAEDVEINREIVLTLLEPMQMTINCAENGVAAVRLFTESPDKYNLIFMDIQMPEMDGYTATRAIRAFENEHPKEQTNKNLSPERSGGVPIIAMTANVFREDVERCLEAGMNGHIGKPIDFNEVINVLRQYI